MKSGTFGGRRKAGRSGPCGLAFIGDGGVAGGGGDWCIADKCYGYGLAQLEAEVKFRTGGGDDSGIVDMER